MSKKASTTIKQFFFGKAEIPTSQIFIIRSNVFAFICHKPFLQGHVLVSPTRIVKKLSDLTENETLDLWVTAQQVSRTLENIYNKTCSIVVQNGPAAGQSVEHVHIHVIPIENNVEWSEFKAGKKKPRSQEDMAEEANLYRDKFDQFYS